jgi:hypothetical protein
MATLRREIRIHAPASEVWKVVGRPEILHLWFPGLTNCTVNGNVRIIMLGSGMPMPEEIITNDSLQRRFQYRITVPIFKFHLATVDVIDLFDDTCLVVYSTDADPGVMALVIGGGTTGALEELRKQFESGVGPALDAVGININSSVAAGGTV